MRTELTVYVHIGADCVPCGQLTMLEDGPTLREATFAYCPSYIQERRAFGVDPVSLSLIDRSTAANPVMRPANGLVHFGAFRDAAPDSWGRRVIESRFGAAENRLPESQYLLHAGVDRLGALEIRGACDDEPPLELDTTPTLEQLITAAEFIDEGRPVPDGLEGIFAHGAALGGARPKACVRDTDGVLWLAKFSSRRDRFDVPTVEYATLRLAAEAGLDVPSVELSAVAGKPVMLIRRFDRVWTAAGTMSNGLEVPGAQSDARVIEERLGMVSALTLLGCDEMESRTKSYRDVAEALRTYCHPSVVQRNLIELYGRMVFNILVSNDDDHLRNHACLFDPRLRGWRLSALYDVLPRSSFASERYLHLEVGPQGRLATLDNAFAAHADFGLSSQAACEVIGRVGNVVRNWRSYFGRYGVPETELDRIATAFRDLDDVCAPELRLRLP